MARKGSFRFDFEVPTPKALAALLRLIALVGDKHSAWTHPNGMMETHSFSLTIGPNGGEPAEIRDLISILYRGLKRGKMVPPWPIDPDNFRTSLKKRGQDHLP